MRPEFISLGLLLLIALSRHQSGGDPAPFLLYAALFSTALWLRSSRERRRRDFVQQLKSCRKELRSGGTVVIDHNLVRYRSVIATYNMNIGGLLCSVLVPSPYRVLDANDEHHDSTLCSLASLLFGWWSIPGGPVQTLTNILQNISGGQRQTVAELIDLPLLKKAAARRAEMEANRAEAVDETTAVFAPAAHGDAGPSSRVNFELLRGSSGYRTAAESTDHNRKRAFIELAGAPPGDLWVETVKGRMRKAVADYQARAELRRANSSKHADLTSRNSSSDVLRS